MDQACKCVVLQTMQLYKQAQLSDWVNNVMLVVVLATA